MFDAPAVTLAFEAELVAAIAAVTIRSPAEFSFDGVPAAIPSYSHTPDPSGVPGIAGPPIGLIGSIRDTLYNRCYAHRLGEPLPLPSVTDPVGFTHGLERANAGRERWEPGWIIQWLGPNGQLHVRKGEMERAAIPGSFIMAVSHGAAPQPGGAVVLRVPTGGLGIQPGYYFAFGETLDELADQSALVRVYFHCLALDAQGLVGLLTQALNRFQVPFQLKVPSAPNLYGRTDAGVLYVGARYIQITLRVIEAVRPFMKLATSVPLFTKMLWPGIAAAVDPGTGESFGLHRCRLVAEGIVQAWSAEQTDHRAGLAAVAGRFAAAGLDIARPWLGPGWADLFVPPMQPATV